MLYRTQQFSFLKCVAQIG